MKRTEWERCALGVWSQGYARPKSRIGIWGLVMTQNVVVGGKRRDGAWKRQARGAPDPEEGVLWRTYGAA